MGEMAEVFNGLKAHNKQRKDERSAVNAQKLQELGIPAREQSKNVFRVDTEWGAVMYYPGSNMWQHKGKTKRGTVAQFKEWLQQQGFVQ